MNFYVTVLGSGAALPIGARRCSAQLLNINGFKLLLDCAEGTQDRIRQNHIRLQSIGTIVISHLHGDHFFGLPGLLSTMHLCGRTEPVTVVCPQGAKQIVETLFTLSGNHIDYPICWHEIPTTTGGIVRVLENKRCTVDAFPLKHSVPTYGYRITAVDRPDAEPLTYCYCCDTVYDESILPHISNATMLCIESTFSNEYSQLAEQRFHLTAGQAARLARLAGVKSLLLTHISARFREPELLLGQACQEFQNTVIAADNMRLELGKPLPHTPSQSTGN